TRYIDETTYAEIYTVAGVVYKGRFAEVKQIVRKSDKKRYAAKCFMREFTQTDNEWEDVEREISIMRCIRHRNIVAYHEAVKMNNQLIMIMKWYALSFNRRINYHSGEESAGRTIIVIK
ncbi:unnamed protein product, partial [Onchocerca flexuosa]|uniref:Protein kinase domain-containing protein n=1 Tax=Onchocerca flexuosa TaxID=387005 RepID=A0A183I1Q6_9BILA